MRARGFSVYDALLRAEELLSRPPPLEWIKRPEPKGDLVARFVLPLALCQARNAITTSAMMAGMKHGSGKAPLLGKYKEQVFRMMWVQHHQQIYPLPGRAFVRCIRFSVRETDPNSDWAKAALDVLCVRTPRFKKRLGFIRDDKGSVTESTQHWEPVKSHKEGFGLIDIFTG